MDVTSRTPFKDVFTGSTPTAWLNVGVEFQFAFFKGDPNAGGQLLDVTDFQAVILDILAANLAGLPYAEKAAGIIDTALTFAEWNANISTRNGFERACHAYIGFEGAELALGAGSFALLVRGSTSDDPTDPDCFGLSTIQFIGDGIPTTVGPVQAGNAIPANAAYDVTGNYTLNGLTGNTVYVWTQNANDATLVNAGQTLNASGLFTAAANSVTLTGTPLQPVTAAVRVNPLLDATTADARYWQKNAAAAFADGVPLIMATDGLVYKLRVRKTPNGLVTFAPDQVGVAAPGFTKIPILCADDGLYHDLTLIRDQGTVSASINPVGYNL